MSVIYVGNRLLQKARTTKIVLQERSLDCLIRTIKGQDKAGKEK